MDNNWLINFDKHQKESCQAYIDLVVLQWNKLAPHSWLNHNPGT